MVCLASHPPRLYYSSEAERVIFFAMGWLVTELLLTTRETVMTRSKSAMSKRTVAEHEPAMGYRIFGILYVVMVSVLTGLVSRFSQLAILKAKHLGYNTSRRILVG
jgi:hypothetical protein